MAYSPKRSFLEPIHSGRRNDREKVIGTFHPYHHHCPPPQLPRQGSILNTQGSLASTRKTSRIAHSDILQKAFTKDSYHPDSILRAQLDEVINSDYVRSDEHEPLTYKCHKDGNKHTSSSKKSKTAKTSSYIRFIKRPGSVCLLCGSQKTSLSRALGCVRAHLDHRPFRCSGCELCNVIDGYVLD